MKRIRLTEQELINVIGQIINEEFNTTLPIQYKPVLSQQYTSQQPQQPPTNQQPMRSQQPQRQLPQSRIKMVRWPDMDPGVVCRTCYEAFRKAGATDGAAKGILANIAAESRFNPNLLALDGDGTTFAIGGGLCGFKKHGWLEALAKHCGYTAQDVENLNDQIMNSGLPYPNMIYGKEGKANKEYIMSKFGTFPFSFQQQLSFITSNEYFENCKNLKDPNKVAKEWMIKFERPKNKKKNRWTNNGKLVLRYLGMKK